MKLKIENIVVDSGELVALIHSLDETIERHQRMRQLCGEILAIQNEAGQNEAGNGNSSGKRGSSSGKRGSSSGKRGSGRGKKSKSSDASTFGIDASTTSLGD